jgi:hypothetical protein
MRHEPIGYITALLLASATVAAGCSATSNGDGTGGSSGGVGGSGSGSGGSGAKGGSSGNGGSGAGGAGGGGGVTSLSGTKAVNALTTTEAGLLCSDIYSYFGTAIPRATACKWKGLSYAASSSAPTQAMLQQNCTMQQNGCLPSDAATFSNPGCGDIPTNCTATVAQYSACIADEVTAFSQTVGGLPTCTALTSAGTSAIFDAQSGGTPPASCASLSDACPALYPPSPLTTN